MKGAGCEFSHDLSQEPCARLLLLGACDLVNKGKRCDRLHDLSSLSSEEVSALRERFRHGQEQREKLGQRTIEGWRGSDGGGEGKEAAGAEGAEQREESLLLPLSAPAASAPAPAPAPAPALPVSMESTWLPLEEARRLVSSGGGAASAAAAAAAASGAATAAEGRESAASAALAAARAKEQQGASEQLAGLLASKT